MNKIISKEPMTFWIGGYDKEKFEQPHFLSANKVEFINNHLMFYLDKELIFKVWLKNWKKYKSIEEALEGIDIKKV